MIEWLAFGLTILFWILFLGRTAMLTRRGVKVFVLAKGKSLGTKILELALVPLLILWTTRILLLPFGIDPLNLPVFWNIPALRWVGLTLCAAGLVIFALALAAFGTAWRVGIDEEKSNELVTGGIFAFSRNPIFLFMDMFFLGVFLVYPDWIFLAFFVGFALGIHRQILNEEKFLRTRFGADYARYCEKTRRYV